LTEERIIRPAKNIYGSLRLPGDKSISHRYGMLAAFAEGTSRFTNFSTGADCASTLVCMEALGARVRRLEDGSVEVTGVGGRVTATAERAGLRQLRLDDAHDLRAALAAAGPLYAGGG
jgi:3-phosphoshikimate 1-carboxyvinyltransferase